MPVVNTYALPATQTPEIHAGAFTITRVLPIASGAASNADNITVLTIGRNARLTMAFLRNSATLGASCTLKMQRNRGGTRTDLTVATTAGSASVVSGITLGPVDLLAGDIIELLVGGANIGAAASVEVDLLLQHN